ncbi:MAG TPA: SCP2 sterol-binding domain-containing protein [Actinomycetota bacterium]|jgi:putative sterol carrier protein
MSVTYLTDEWASAAQEALNANEGFRAAVGSNVATLQQVITTDDGDKRYFFKLVDGRAEVGMGDAENPDATVSQDYATAVAIQKNELSPVAAYMSGKLRVTGDLMKLMTMQGVLMQMPDALKDLEVEY